MKKILVCGGREYCDQKTVDAVLSLINPDEIVQGGAHGADALAEHWGFTNSKVVHTHYADWETHGRSAGPRRNAEMLKSHLNILACVAFAGGKGTLNMIEQAKKKGIPVLQVIGSVNAGT